MLPFSTSQRPGCAATSTVAVPTIICCESRAVLTIQGVLRGQLVSRSLDSRFALATVFSEALPPRLTPAEVCVEDAFANTEGFFSRAGPFRLIFCLFVFALLINQVLK